MTGADVRALTKSYAKDALKNGHCALHNEEAMEITISNEIATNHELMPETTKMVLMGVLVTMEMKRLDGPAASHH